MFCIGWTIVESETADIQKYSLIIAQSPLLIRSVIATRPLLIVCKATLIWRLIGLHVLRYVDERELIGKTEIKN